MKKIIWVISLILLFATVAAANQTQKTEVLIGFKEKVNKNVVSQNGGTIKKELINLPIISVEIPANKISELKKNKDIEFIEEDGVWSVNTQSLPWGIDQIDAELVQAQDISGQGVKVAIIDTGISIHEDLSVKGGKNFISKNGSYIDDNGHGTHVAGTIAGLNNNLGVVGVAPAAELYALKALDKNGSANWSNIAQAIDWAITNKMQIINMSFGGSVGSKTVERVINKAYNSGILLIAAAGNEGANSIIYPANYSTVIAVGATDDTNTIASFSNRGSKLELVAPGVDINSTFLGNSYISASGTSMATPHVVGTAALIWSKYPGLTNTEVRERLKSSATDLGATGFDTTYGYGLVNANKAIQ